MCVYIYIYIYIHGYTYICTFINMYGASWHLVHDPRRRTWRGLGLYLCCAGKHTVYDTANSALHGDRQIWSYFQIMRDPSPSRS